MQAIQQVDAEVIVIDNCSTDGSIEYLKKKFTKVKFIVNEKNEGFAKANNTALKQCRSEFILFLNPDTIIPENILENCISFFQQHENAGAVGVKMIDGSGKFLPESKRSFPSPLISFFKLCGLADLFPKSALFNRYALGYLPQNEINEVDVLCGAFIMAKRNVLKNISGFDEAFFMYGEDIDLCYRIQQQGFKIFYLGTETIIHFKGESARKGSLNYVRIFYRAMNVFVKKHYKGSNAGLMIFFLQAGIYLRAALSLIASPFRRLFKNNASKTLAVSAPVLLIGDAASTAEAEMIICKSRSGATIKKTDFTNQKIPLTIEPIEIVLCTGQLSYNESISLVLSTKNNHQFKWHGLHTGSVAGSINKKFTGMIYSLED